MNRSIMLKKLPRAIGFVFALLLIVSSSFASDKKGVGVADLKAADRVAALNVTWYYTWKPQPIDGAPDKKFVPMVWGGNRLDKNISDVRAKGKVPLLLAINEPNMTDQANMSVEETIRRWPEIRQLAEKISSPVTAGGALGPWFENFYNMAAARNLKFDFIAVHLYTPPDADKFLAKIDAMYEKYHMPIWITEFAVADWEASKKKCKASCENRFSEDDVLAFMKIVLPELEKRPFVQRYAWFGAGKASLDHEAVRTSRLFEKNGSLTPLGRFYSQFQ